MTLTGSISVAYWVIAVAASALYGWKAVEIFTDVPSQRSRPPAAWWWHQRWLNFLGSLVGWVALWILGRKLVPCVAGRCNPGLEGSYALLGFLAFVGVTGYLPYGVVGILTGASTLAAKATEVVAGLRRKPDA